MFTVEQLDPIIYIDYQQKYLYSTQIYKSINGWYVNNIFKQHNLCSSDTCLVLLRKLMTFTSESAYTKASNHS